MVKFVFSPEVILCGWLGLKHQLTNSLGRRLEGKGDLAVYQPMISVPAYDQCSSLHWASFWCVVLLSCHAAESGCSPRGASVWRVGVSMLSCTYPAGTGCWRWQADVQNSRSKCPLLLQLPIPCLPRTPFHSLKSCPTLALKSPEIRSFVFGGNLPQEVVQVAVEGHLYSSFSLQSRCIHTEDSGKLLVLDWES